MENKEAFLFNIEGYVYFKDKPMTLEDAKEFENKFFEFIISNNYYFTGMTQIEEEE